MPRFPIRVTAFGLAAVLIPEADYLALVERDASISKSGRLARLDKDPEVRAFILDRLGTMDMELIRSDAMATFGAGRVPSRSTVNRLAMRVRAGRGRRER